MNTQMVQKRAGVLVQSGGRTVRWMALRAWLPLLVLALSGCSGNSVKMPTSIAGFNQQLLDGAALLWGCLGGLWILGWIFWFGTYAIQGWWDEPWKKVSNWGKPALIYCVLSNIGMGLLYAYAAANVNGYVAK